LTEHHQSKERDVTIQTDRESAAPLIDEILQPYLKFINSTPELVSMLYDIDMMPEQTTSITGAIRLAAFCEVWKRMEDYKTKAAAV
jgi:hypothetical protein